MSSGLRHKVQIVYGSYLKKSSQTFTLYFQWRPHFCKQHPNIMHAPCPWKYQSGGLQGTTSLEPEKATMKVVPFGKIMESSKTMSSLTWMSWLSKIFNLISPASLDKESYTVKFKFFSRATLFHSLFLFGPLLLAILASAVNGNHLQIHSKSWIFTYET